MGIYVGRAPFEYFSLVPDLFLRLWVDFEWSSDMGYFAPSIPALNYTVHTEWGYFGSLPLTRDQLPSIKSLGVENILTMLFCTILCLSVAKYSEIESVCSNNFHQSTLLKIVLLMVWVSLAYRWQVIVVFKTNNISINPLWDNYWSFYIYWSFYNAEVPAGFALL